MEETRMLSNLQQATDFFEPNNQFAIIWFSPDENNQNTLIKKQKCSKIADYKEKALEKYRYPDSLSERDLQIEKLEK